jgi:hypothetical protein
MQTVSLALQLAFVALLALAATSSGPYDSLFLKNYQPSCSGARKIREDNVTFCSMVDWLAGRLYNTSTFTVYSPGTPLDAQQQTRAAEALAAELLASTGADTHSPCGSAVQRLACVTAFPYCAAAGDSVSSLSYMPPCQLQCTQLSHICKSRLYTEPFLSPDCSSLHTNHNCMLKIPSDRFLLKPEQVSLEAGSCIAW